MSFFDSSLQTVTPSRIQKPDNRDFFKVLDLVSLQTSTFWIQLDSETILENSDNVLISSE
jgi:hypothetical protein